MVGLRVDCFFVREGPAAESSIPPAPAAAAEVDDAEAETEGECWFSLPLAAEGICRDVTTWVTFLLKKLSTD